MKRMILAITIVTGMLFAASFSSTSVSVAMDDTAQFVQKNCTVCHGLDKICPNLGQNEAWWTSTISRMAGRGAAIEEAQIPALASSLSSPGEEMLKACGK